MTDPKDTKIELIDFDKNLYKAFLEALTSSLEKVQAFALNITKEQFQVMIRHEDYYAFSACFNKDVWQEEIIEWLLVQEEKSKRLQMVEDAAELALFFACKNGHKDAIKWFEKRFNNIFLEKIKEDTENDGMFFIQAQQAEDSDVMNILLEYENYLNYAQKYAPDYYVPKKLEMLHEMVQQSISQKKPFDIEEDATVVLKILNHLINENNDSSYEEIKFLLSIPGIKKQVNKLILSDDKKVNPIYYAMSKNNRDVVELFLLRFFVPNDHFQALSNAAKYKREIITAQYLCSEETIQKAQAYLELLQQKKTKPGRYLNEQLKTKKWKVEEIGAEDLIVLLMNTRRPALFAEHENLSGKGGWNYHEFSILSEISFSTEGTHALNNGAHRLDFVDHKKPLEVNFLFVSSALLFRKDADPQSLCSGNHIDEEAFYKFYERRLLPGLLKQNQIAKRDGKKLVLNIPGLGTGCFAKEEYRKPLKETYLPRALKRFFEEHGAKFDCIHTVNYDPFDALTEDHFTGNLLFADHNIKLMARPLQKLPKGAPGQPASQLEFPKDGTDYDDSFRLIKIVAWDPFSYPGNDIWSGARQTDDGVSFASSDAILALFSMGQFGHKNYVHQITYDEKWGSAYPVDPKNGKPLAYYYDPEVPKGCVLYKRYSEVTPAMIEVVSTDPISIIEESNDKIEIIEVINPPKNNEENIAFKEFIEINDEEFIEINEKPFNDNKNSNQPLVSEKNFSHDTFNKNLIKEAEHLRNYIRNRTDSNPHYKEYSPGFFTDKFIFGFQRKNQKANLAFAEKILEKIERKEVNKSDFSSKNLKGIKKDLDYRMFVGRSDLDKIIKDIKKKLPNP